MMVGYCWYKKLPQTQAIHEARIPPTINEYGSFSSKTTSDWYNFHRDVCRESLLLNNDGMIGGVGKEVEIDESAFSKRKYHRGSYRATHWVFGGIERGSNKCFFVSVKRRNKRTLWPLIFKHIAPGTKIVSDCWSAYTGIHNYNNYQHQNCID